MKSILPEYFGDKSIKNEQASITECEETQQTEASSETDNPEEANAEEADAAAVVPCKESDNPSQAFEVKLLRIQGIEPKLETPFSWVVNNLMNPDHFLHICVYAKCSS